ncbi:MAG: hypothetical protein JO246_05495 [Frankiaceae bacterium]|nr:hypothetical protein [Frankiaceae bacterium]MBV9869035.1 hypothetical protein [Frankiaceae bacterium]
MNTDLPPDVVAFADSARHSLTRLGGVDLALRTEVDRDLREPVSRALASIGAFELDVRGDLDELLAGAQLCRIAGAVALAWPVVDELLSVDGARLALINPAAPRVDHGDLGGEWVGADLDGEAHSLEFGEPRSRAKLGPFLMPASLGPARPPVAADDVARHLVLGSWRVLGSLEAALDQVVEHVGARKQFGQALAEFQAVRFAIADASVAVRGLEELAKFTTWRLVTASAAHHSADACALRLHAVDTAVAVLRTCHQMLGAIGFCDEHDVSVLDRHLQPLLRLPVSAESLALRLVPTVEAHEFETLFS